ncbi:MAG: ATP-binding protein [Gammaproteobacteria bacterium]
MAGSLNHWSIRRKLAAFIFLPAFGFAYFCLSALHERYLQHEETRAAIGFAATAQPFIDLLAAFQAERAASQNYRLVADVEHRQQLLTARNLTNASIDAVSHLAAGLSSPSLVDHFGDELRYLVAGLEKLDEVRNAVDSNTIIAAPYYSSLVEGNLALLDAMVLSQYRTPTADVLVSLLQLNERVHRETDAVRLVILEGQIDAPGLEQLNQDVALQRSLWQPLLESAMPSIQLLVRRFAVSKVDQDSAALRVEIVQQALDRSTKFEKLAELRRLIDYRAVARGDVKANQLLMNALLQDAHTLFLALTAMPENWPGETLLLESLLADFQDYGKLTNAQRRERDDSNRQLIDGLSRLPILERRTAWDALTSERLGQLRSITDHLVERLIIDLKVKQREAGIAFSLYALVVFLVLGAVFGFGGLLLQRMVRDLKGISRAMHAMSREPDEDKALQIEGSDEVARMAQAFNQMMAHRRMAVDRQMQLKDELLQLKEEQAETLEAKVRERTEALEVARRAADAASQAKSQFLGNVSHHVRTPLNAIINYARMVQGRLPAAGDARSHLAAVIDNAEQLDVLMADILALARLDSEAANLQVEPVSMAQFVDDVYALMVQSDAGKGLRFGLEVSGVLPAEVLGDSGRLLQAFACIIDNAFKFTVTGEVRVTLLWQQETQVLEARVEDTGMGMDKDLLARVFDGFEQGTVGCESVEGGIGLGLTLASRLVEHFGGKVSMESEPGAGTQVTMLIPLKVAGPAMINVARLEGRAEASKETEAPGITAGAIAPALLQELKAGLECGDYLALIAAVDKVQDQEIAASLRALVLSYDYDSLHALIRQYHAAA